MFLFFILVFAENLYSSFFFLLNESLQKILFSLVLMFMLSFELSNNVELDASYEMTASVSVWIWNVSIFML